MKVTGASSSTPASPASRPRAGAPGFSVSSASGSAPAHAAASVSVASGVSDVSALMALQGLEDATERRRRSVRRASGLLDRLDDLKLAMLSGAAPGPALEGLARSLRETVTGGDDPGLDSVIGQIDLRAAVELAKAEQGRSAA